MFQSQKEIMEKKILSFLFDFLFKNYITLKFHIACENKEIK